MCTHAHTHTHTHTHTHSLYPGHTVENRAKDSTLDTAVHTPSYSGWSASLIAAAITVCVAAVLVLVVVLCVGGGSSTMDQVRATASRTVEESTDGYYMNAKFLNSEWLG